MTGYFRVLLAALALLGLVSCAKKPDQLPAYHGESVTLIEVHKADRKMFLIHDGKILKSYDIQLGGVPVGKKHFEGDKKTPEGAYMISHRNPRSTYHLSLGISYPNKEDRAFAKLAGKEPGGDIFIHGQPGWVKVNGDWTVGCIAVTDKEMDEIYRMVNPGTQINIFP